MTIKSLVLTAAVALAAALPCAAQEEQPDMAELMKAMTGALGGGTNAPALVDFRELKALLPASLEGMKRVSASGEKSGAMGMSVAFAEAKYRAEDGGEITIKISDNSGMGGLMGFAQQAFGTMEVDRETETGFERTTQYGKHKATEEYDNEEKEGEVEIMVDSRFAVEVEGRNVTWKAVEAAAKSLDLDKLASLKPPTPAAE